MGSFISSVTSNPVASAAGALGLGGFGAIGQQLTGTGLGGLGNSFQAQGATSLYNPGQLGLQQGIQDSAAAFNQNQAQQQALAGQLQAQAAGAGPNPAQIAMRQGTNRAIQQSAGMLASQKGISPALAQRLAAQNAAGMSQQAAGQGALLGAQQQLGAQNALGGLYGQMGNQQLSMNSNLQQALASWNNNQVGMQSNMNNANAQVTSANSAQKGALAGGLMQGAGAGLAMLAMDKGGEVPQKMAVGGEPQVYNWGFNSHPIAGESGPASFAGQYLANDKLEKGMGSASTNFVKYMAMSPNSSDNGAGFTPGFDSPSGSDIVDEPSWFFGDNPRPNAQPVFSGGPDSAIPFARGAMVPGKAKVRGDSLKNDKVPAMLSPKEIVLPRSVTMHPDAPRKAAEFVAAVQAKHKRRVA